MRRTSAFTVSIVITVSLHLVNAQANEGVFERSAPSTPAPALIAHIQQLNAQIREAHRAGRIAERNSLLDDRLHVAERVLLAKGSSLEFYLGAKAKIHSLMTLAQDDEDTFYEAVEFAEKLISENDIRLRRLGEFNRLGLMLLAFPDASETDLAHLVKQYKSYVTTYKLNHGSLELGRHIVHRFEEEEHGRFAADMYRIMAEHAQSHAEYVIRQHAQPFRQRADSVHLVGERLEIDHSGYFTQRVTNNDYAGRVLLVHFWNSTPYGMRDFASLKRNLRKHRMDGFEVLGVNLDTDHRSSLKVIRKQVLPWVNLFEVDDPSARGFQHPLAQKVQLKQAPTSVLLNRDGVVVSMNARGPELDRLLKVHLKEPIPVRHITRWRQKGRAFLAQDELDPGSKEAIASDLPDLLKIQADADARVKATDNVSAAED